jgi:hypothetical protein
MGQAFQKPSFVFIFQKPFCLLFSKSRLGLIELFLFRTKLGENAENTQNAQNESENRQKRIKMHKMKP